jgi:hypothetical protein
MRQRGSTPRQNAKTLSRFLSRTNQNPKAITSAAGLHFLSCQLFVYNCPEEANHARTREVTDWAHHRGAY